LSQYCYVIVWDPERPKTKLDANTVAELKRDVAHEIVVEYCKRNELFYEMSAFYSNNGDHTSNIENLLISVSDEIDRYADEEKWYKTVADHYAAKTFNELSQENKDIFFMTVKENLELMKDTLEEYLELISNDMHLGEQQGKIKGQAELLKAILEYAEDRNGNVFTKFLSFDKPLSEAALFPAIRGKDLSPEQQYMKDSNDSYKAVYKPYAKTVKESFDTIKEYELLYRDFPKQNEALRERVALFIEVLREYRKTVNERKADLGGIDFVDMERAAIDILRHKDIADRLRKRYKYILIDEYQDTNDIQETLVRLICRKDPGNVFRVGDIKQSIYGFRSAKPSLMKEILKNAEDDEKIVFHENFRSSDIIIRFNNIIYSILMNIGGFSDTFSDEIDKASTILQNKKDNKEKCEIHLLDLSVEGEKRPVREDRIDEAYYIVDRIRKMREISQKRKEETKDEWSGLDEKKQKEWLYDHGIYADWKDYVILVRKHDHKTVMENAFRALDVPMFYIINKGYYDDVAVQTVISWL
ncbi:MAG: UvrD-helicase domain-containing protein, partial [Erysipelotrichaceae bacterium]|nr:UvrD-helicase domain-containing protein [Erysipelotrichaceae bacterium]